MDNTRSFLGICADLNIPNIEYVSTMAEITINGISIQQWADMDEKQFIIHIKSLDKKQRKSVEMALKSCELALR